MVTDLIKSGGVIAELGVFQGTFLKELHAAISPSFLVGIDLFTGTCGSGDQDGNNHITISLDDAYLNLLTSTASLSTIKIEKGYSSEVLLNYPDNHFDMIYIDADHSYEGCKRDLYISRAKTKPNGWIMGHDYELNMTKARTAWGFGVKQAVDEFCNETRLSIGAKGYDGCVSYGIRNEK
jgi:hypothetical protein